jgi:glycosyltransferase involved in cell wall biosynthesis
MASDDFTGLPEPWAAVPVTVVMPTYNEIGSLKATCERVLSLPLPRLHLKVVDDNSPDGTGKLAEELAERAGILREAVLGRMTSASYRFQVEAKYLALRDGHATIEVPITLARRQAGASKMNLAV